ncbi:unnamed protein product, partial [Ilex paraguariensis]
QLPNSHDLSLSPFPLENSSSPVHPLPSPDSPTTVRSFPLIGSSPSSVGQSQAMGNSPLFIDQTSSSNPLLATEYPQPYRPESPLPTTSQSAPTPKKLKSINQLGYGTSTSPSPCPGF